MLKIFLVLYVGTGVGGTWGPQPGPYSACASMAQKRQALIDKVAETGVTETGMRVTVAQRSALRTWKFRCIEAVKRPEVGENL